MSELSPVMWTHFYLMIRIGSFCCCLLMRCICTCYTPSFWSSVPLRLHGVFE